MALENSVGAGLKHIPTFNKNQKGEVSLSPPYVLCLMSYVVRLTSYDL